MDISKILAKDTGETLIDHSRRVMDEVLKLQKDFIKKGNHDSEYVTTETMKLAATYHDLGKATKQFQTKMKKYGEFVDTLVTNAGTPMIKHRHAEVSFAFLSAYTNMSDEVLKIIYFHHSLSPNNYMIPVTTILKNVTDEDIELMKSYVRENDPNLLLDTPKFEGFTPSFFTNKDGRKSIINDSEFLIGLSLFIVGDRIASGAIINVETLINKVTKNITQTNPYAPSERTSLQEELSNINDKMFSLNAPTGFGKTLIAMKWGLKSERKVFIVSPRVIINKAVFDNLNSELENNQCNASNSLIESNEIKGVYNTKGVQKGVNTDFITINIDSFLNGTFNYDSIDMLFCLLHCDVVFDEYHELLNGGGITGVFRRVLMARKWFGKGRTMLMSATPININNFIDQAQPIQTYPNDGGFYPTVHNKTYDISFKTLDGEDFTIDNEKYYTPNDTITFLNSKEDAKRFANHLNTNQVIHYELLESDKELKRQSIKNFYGKEKSSITGKEGWIGTLILRTSLDVSFRHMLDVVCSPMATIQSIGRCNRFGDMDDSSITFARMKSRSDSKTIQLQFQRILSVLWYEFLEEKLTNGKATLDEIYALYIEFMDKYKDQFQMYLTDKFNDGEKYIDKIFPKKRFVKVKTDVEKIIGGSNILRKKGGTIEIFVIAKDNKGNLMESPMNYTIYLANIDRNPIFQILGYKSEYEMIKHQRKFWESVNLDERFDYKKIPSSKTIPFSTIIDNSIDSTKPIFIENGYYDPGKGLFINRTK